MAHLHDPVHVCEPVRRVVVSNSEGTVILEVDSVPPQCQNHLESGPDVKQDLKHVAKLPVKVSKYVNCLNHPRVSLNKSDI